MIGERIKQLRLEKGYSITELAEVSGVSKSYLSYIERNLQTNPSLQFLTKLLVPLDTTIEVLIGINNRKDNSTFEDHFDEEWKEILQKAISQGMNKEDFKKIRDFIEFNKWIKDRQSSGNDNS
ncbi:MAG: helix-turn-helix domain-containing protein [Bacillus sp. (in: firmicutes)]